MRQIFLDTETTGLSPESGDRVIEIGCVELHNRKITGNNKHFYLNPERPNSEDAVKIHGLTDEFLADKPLFSAVAEEFVEYCRGAEIVIHNAAFDVGFLNEELRRLGKPAFTTYVASVTDSWHMAREMFPGKSNSLDALCRRLEIDNSSRTLHGALLDAGLLCEVYVRLTRGQDSLIMDVSDTSGEAGEAIVVDFSQFELMVLQPSEEELACHAALLEGLDKASKGKTVWRSFEPAPESAPAATTMA